MVQDRHIASPEVEQEGRLDGLQDLVCIHPDTASIDVDPILTRRDPAAD